MKCKRLNEVIELLQPAAERAGAEPDAILQKLAKKPVTTVSWSIFPTIS